MKLGACYRAVQCLLAAQTLELETDFLCLIGKVRYLDDVLFLDLIPYS